MNPGGEAIGARHDPSNAAGVGGPRAISVFALILINLPYLLWIVILIAAFEVCAVAGLPFFLALRRGRLDDAFRLHHSYFGRVIGWGLWPLVRIRRVGFDEVQDDGPEGPKGPKGSCVYVTNHRSFADIFVCSLVPQCNAVVGVRSWPFRIWPLGWFMRRAGYLEMEACAMEDVLEASSRLTARGVSFMFYPEGHRSRDGALRKFRSGAFLLATHNNIPVAPICLTGTEQIFRGPGPLISPARVTIERLPALHPSAFPEKKRALLLRRQAERMIEEKIAETERRNAP